MIRKAAKRVGAPVVHRRALAARSRFYARFVDAGQLCFDVGAHRGDRTRALRAIGARVVAVEPQPEFANKLRRRFKKDGEVVVEAVGLSDEEGEMELHLATGAPTIATAAPHWQTGRFQSASWVRSISVPTTTLDALIQRFGSPIFCKIDVEGYELTVLRGLTRPLRCISFEFTIEFLDEAAHCLSYLAALGEIEVNLSLGETLELHLKDWAKPEEAIEEIRRLGREIEDLWGDIYVRSISSSN